MIINEIELDFDIFDVDIAERYENALEKVQEEGKPVEGEKNSVVIRRQCNSIFNFFDEVFGEGTSKDIFGDRVNLMLCLKAFEEVVEDVAEQTKEAEKLTAKYSPNRAQRRLKK